MYGDRYGLSFNVWLYRTMNSFLYIAWHAKRRGNSPITQPNASFSWILCTFRDPPWHCTCGWILSKATQDGELLIHLSPVLPSFAPHYIGLIITWSEVHPPWHAVGHKHLNLEITLTVILSSWGRPKDKSKSFLALHSKLHLGAGRWYLYLAIASKEWVELKSGFNM